VATSKGKKVRIKALGDIRGVRADELRANLRTAVEQGARNVILDLSKVQMIDQTGLGVLVAARNSLHRSGGQISVTNPAGDVDELLRTLRIHHHFGLGGD
jgi:anti-sigma B factor antagonist